MKFHFFGLQNFIFWAQGSLFSNLFVFSRFTESFQNLLSLLTNSVDLVARDWNQLIQNLLRPLSYSVNLERPIAGASLIMPDQVDNRKGFTNEVSYSANSEKLLGSTFLAVLGG